MIAPEEKYRVYFQESNLTIQIESANQKYWLYEIDLEKCIDSTEVLDYILQIADKQWCTPQLIFDLLKEINQASLKIHGVNAQAVFCQQGLNQKVSWNQTT